MDPNYSQSQPSRNDTAYSESPLPAGFINPFASQNAQLLPAAENDSTSAGSHTGLSEIPIALSTSTNIQTLQPFSQDQAQFQLNIPRQRLQRQSFDISMLPPHAAPQRPSRIDQQNNAVFAKQATIGLDSKSDNGQLDPAFRIQSMQIPQSIQNYSNQASTSAQQSRQSPSQDPSRGSIGIMSIGNTGISDIALLLSGAVKLKTHTSGKPPYSYATLITYAIMKHPRKQMTLNEIYSWVMEHYPYFKTAGSGWKNSIRHNLSLSKTFVRIPRPINEPGKGAYWTVDLAVLDATMNNQPKPVPQRFTTPMHEQQIYGASGSNAGGAQRYSIAPPGIPSLPTRDMPSGILAPGSLAMGMTSSISEVGLVQNAPLPGDSPTFRRASLHALPTHGRYQPYPMPTGMALGAPRPQFHGIGPGASYTQQILNNLNPFTMPAASGMYGGANGGRIQARNTEIHPGIPENARAHYTIPALPTDINRGVPLGMPLMSSSTIPAAPAKISNSGSHGQSVSVESQFDEPNTAAVLRQDSKIGASDTDEYKFTSEFRVPTSQQQEPLSADAAELTTPTSAFPVEAYSQVKSTPSLPDYLLTSHDMASSEVNGNKRSIGRQAIGACVGSTNDVSMASSEQTEQIGSGTGNSAAGNDLSAYFTFNGV